MPSGVGMADIVIGKALWNDLVRQIAFRACARGDTLHKANLSHIRHQAQTPIDNATAHRVRTATDAAAGNHRHSRAFKNLAVIRRHEAPARRHDEVVGGPCAGAVKPIWESVDALPATMRR